MTVRVTPGCYIDGAIPRTQFELNVMLRNLLKDWNPKDAVLNEPYSIDTIEEYADELINELTAAINLAIDPDQVAIWDAGDLIVCEETEL